jgi:hypothetical protein
MDPSIPYKVLILMNAGFVALSLLSNIRLIDHPDNEKDDSHQL